MRSPTRVLHRAPLLFSPRLTACGAHRGGAVMCAEFLKTTINRYGAFTVARRHVHERPFQELPQDFSQGEAYAVARDALLQLNIMHRRGIEPDALMYTSLIATMGRAGLEWQAYKLFSRMIEQDVQPLPETYVALRDATNKQRVALREQIQTKIEEAVDVFPEALAAAERERQREEDRRCIAKFNEYMRGVLPATSSNAPAAAASTAADASKSAESAREESAESPSASPSPSVASMHIRSPGDAWSAAQRAKEHRSHAQGLAKGESAADLRAALERLDEEELRIYLAAQRQLRHGTKVQLIDRVLQKVSANAIRAMLDRRTHYFRSVEQILAADLRQLNMSGPSAVEQAAPATAGKNTAGGTGKDRTLTSAEQDAVGPDVLFAPWGILRKPMRRRPEPPAPRNAERLERVRLSEPELVLLRQKAETNDVDELPESMLRRYAYQFQLRWRRSDGAASLLQAVQWHVLTYFPGALQPSVEKSGNGLVERASPTPAIRLQKEEEGMRTTLENFETFRVIAQRTNNLQVVDNKEINRHLQHVRLDAIRRERKMENSLRRERHVMEAAGLAASAKTFTPLPMAGEGEMQVLGVTAGATSTADDPSTTRATLPGGIQTSLIPADLADGGEEEAATTEGDDTAVNELPPWALFEEEDEFNLSTGHFGDPNIGRFQELSDAKVRLLPSRSAQAKWSVDHQLLPTSLNDVVQEAELAQQQRHEAVEKEYERRLHYTKYRKWDHLIARAQARQSQERTEESGAAQPLPPKRRLSQLLRKGRDRKRVSEEVQAKFSKRL
ncbi:putative mitochondrial hypothetical protein [Leptomonas pyrrhocoris]|uniref:Uncharacterized protein n=1 Tax=Leptomonas pyrrhocoris TaxID=157538 RepID=A0A0M9G746_LEPPY|nr:putative mitochondrial hypothetical protein [Leptomonas pyrrhocoris]KPA83867.1 putative mitochondrial hypothetical protein [Leptomonas pyrrhocoris]|eukprot:XP_015662306.1 putative mitochondrial hypothetical protein [Leptomonas pyrrhocoris]